jgi:two-component system sensor histidine kinase ChvG
MAVESSRSWQATGTSKVSGSIWRHVAGFARQHGVHFPFTSIALRIFVLNLLALAVLVGGILYLNQFREGLVDAKVNSLLTQGKIIAEAIAQTSSTDSDQFPIQGAEVMEMQSGSFTDSASQALSALSFRIDPEQIAPLLRRMVEPTGARARIYDREGNLLVDSQSFYSRGQIMRFDLPPVDSSQTGALNQAWLWVKSQFRRHRLPVYRDAGADNGRVYDEVSIALNGTSIPIVRVDEQGDTIVSVGVSIQRLQGVMGALMLSTRGGDIDQIIDKERWTIIRIALLVVLVTFLCSLALAGTIAGPMNRLARAAESVRRDVKQCPQIPDFSHRSDEIGDLSRALNDMTKAMYRRIEAIESFAADVAHEFKNPLTSLRSAAETLAIVRTPEDRDRLVAVIRHDVQRLNRLISDISDASRLDAELAREKATSVNLASLLTTITQLSNDVHRGDIPEIILDIQNITDAKGARLSREYMINGHDSRISQVLNNILDNAASFSPKNGKIFISMRPVRKTREIELLIEDEGPGIAIENLEKIFNRFYTDRPEEQGFGENSGLGLHISRQIVEAHGGRIWAENRSLNRSQVGAARTPLHGARFVIRLPMA